MHLVMQTWSGWPAEVQTERLGKKGGLRDFEHGMVVGDRWAAGISEFLLIYWHFLTQPSLYRDWYEKEKISSEQHFSRWKCQSSEENRLAALSW